MGLRKTMLKSDNFKVSRIPNMMIPNRFKQLIHEFFTDLPVRERNYLDIVAKTKLKGEDGFIFL